MSSRHLLCNLHLFAFLGVLNLILITLASMLIKSDSTQIENNFKEEEGMPKDKSGSIVSATPQANYHAGD